MGLQHRLAFGVGRLWTHELKYIKSVFSVGKIESYISYLTWKSIKINETHNAKD